MSQLGLGVMIRALSGGSDRSSSEYAGKLISAVGLTDDTLRISFDGGPTIEVFDNGQSCCEHRYMSSDDDVQSLVGRRLVSISSKDGPEEEDEYGGCHETCFVEVQTDGGFITLTNHNEHNGYYGGFSMEIREVQA